MSWCCCPRWPFLRQLCPSDSSVASPLLSLAEPDCSPGRAQIQGPYLPGGVQHTVPCLSPTIVPEGQGVYTSAGRCYRKAQCRRCLSTRTGFGWLEESATVHHWPAHAVLLPLFTLCVCSFSKRLLSSCFVPVWIRQVPGLRSLLAGERTIAKLPQGRVGF